MTATIEAVLAGQRYTLTPKDHEPGYRATPIIEGEVIEDTPALTSALSDHLLEDLGVPITPEDVDESLTGNPDGISASLNPDCLASKHTACSGTAWDNRTDTETQCQCTCHGWTG